MSNSSFPWPLPLGQMQGAPTGTAPTVTAGTPPANNTAPTQNVAAVGAAPAGTQKDATTSTSDGSASTQKLPPQSPFSGLLSMLPIVLMFVVLYLVLFRGQRKTEKQRKLMIAEMKKGDRVMTIGGLIARVVSIDNDEVVLKIDESANVKATYKKSSIQQVLTPGDEKTK